jgi:IS5 family transposase
VSDSISWRRFCRIDIDARLPHPTTFDEAHYRCGEQAIAALNDELLAKACEARWSRLVTRINAIDGATRTLFRRPHEGGRSAGPLNRGAPAAAARGPANRRRSSWPE